MTLRHIVSDYVARFGGLFSRFWLKKPPPLPPVVLPLAAPAPLPQPAAISAEPPPADGEVRDIISLHSFKDDVLERLDAYATYIRRMRVADPDAYELYSRIGAYVSTETMAGHLKTVNPLFLEKMPTFGATAFLSKQYEKGSIQPRFQYFRKYARGMTPWNVQAAPPGAEFYVVSTYFDEKDDAKILRRGAGGMTEFAVGVEPDGTIHVLRMLIPATQIIRHRRGSDSVVSHMRWGLDPRLRDWAGDNDRKNLAEFLRDNFRLAANFWAGNDFVPLRISATKDDITAAFAIDPLQTPGFFRDRAPVRSASGRTAPIFHVVRPHVRTLPGGRKIGIKMHFAGLRRFEWNGYQIAITVPGKDHASLAEMRGGLIDEDTATRTGKMPNDTMDSRKTGEFLRRYLTTAAGGRRKALAWGN